MPKFRATGSHIEFVKSCGHILGIGSALEVGVFFGLGGKVTVGGSDIYTEAGNSNQEFPLVEKCLERYLEGLFADARYADHFKYILESIKVTKQDPYDSDALAKRYLNNELLVLTLKDMDHCYGVALYEDKFIYTDRYVTGPFSRKEKLVSIFFLKDYVDEGGEKRADFEDKIRAFVKKSAGFFKNTQEVHAALSQVIDLEQPIIHLGDSGQLHGTCAFVSPRSNIEGILQVLVAKQLAEDKDSEPDNESKKDLLVNGNSLIKDADLVKDTRKAYRDFVHHSREFVVHELALGILGKDVDAERKEICYQLAENYIQNKMAVVNRVFHPAVGIKDKDEGYHWENIDKLIRNIRAAGYYDRFKKSHPKIAGRIEAQQQENAATSNLQVDRKFKNSEPVSFFKKNVPLKIYSLSEVKNHKGQVYN